MNQRSRGARLSKRRRLRRGILLRMPLQDLDRHVAIKGAIVGAIDAAHSASPNLFEQIVTIDESIGRVRSESETQRIRVAGVVVEAGGRECDVSAHLGSVVSRQPSGLSSGV